MKLNRIFYFAVKSTPNSFSPVQGQLIETFSKFGEQFSVSGLRLLSLLTETARAVGAEWPRVPGPRPQDRVCVVGAGVAGVHMASRLKGLGYKDVRAKLQCYTNLT